MAKKKKSHVKRTKAVPYKEILVTTENLSRFRDLDTILDMILTEARSITSADAGSLYLVDGRKLIFSYVQNDSLFKGDRDFNRNLYYQHVMDLNDRSIAGHVAMSGRPLVIHDVRKIPASAPYSFNPVFDEKNNYRTKSTLTVPLQITNGRIVGVLQLINAMGKNGKVTSFTQTDELLVNYFAGVAAFTIEKGQQTRAMILRMIKMSELRDPRETGKHVQRVGSYAIEIFERYALRLNMDRKEMTRYKDLLKISSMLHDVGKVAISDTILKKPAKLTEEEFSIMKSHTVLGAKLFDDMASEMDRMCADVSLNHHEKWDGSGYPGKIEQITEDGVVMGKGKAGEEIPLAGRIVALADVFDALISRRVYKEPWPEEKVMEYIRSESGKQFDPQVVDAFLAITPVINAIRDLYAET